MIVSQAYKISSQIIKEFLVKFKEVSTVDPSRFQSLEYFFFTLVQLANMDGPTDCGTQVSNWLDAHQVGIVAHNLEIFIGIFSFSKSTLSG